MLKMNDFGCMQCEGSSANLCEGDNLKSSNIGQSIQAHLFSKTGVWEKGWLNPGPCIFNDSDSCSTLYLVWTDWQPIDLYYCLERKKIVVNLGDLTEGQGIRVQSNKHLIVTIKM